MRVAEIAMGALPPAVLPPEYCDSGEGDLGC
jgi:hypothetical protein